MRQMLCQFILKISTVFSAEELHQSFQVLQYIVYMTGDLLILSSVLDGLEYLAAIH